jgi:hypothetical protein
MSFGGIIDKFSANTLIYSLSYGVWSSVEKPTDDIVLNRYDHNCVSYKGNMLVYGGAVLLQALGNKPKEY